MPCLLPMRLDLMGIVNSNSCMKCSPLPIATSFIFVICCGFGATGQRVEDVLGHARIGYLYLDVVAKQLFYQNLENSRRRGRLPLRLSVPDTQGVAGAVGRQISPLVARDCSRKTCLIGMHLGDFRHMESIWEAMSVQHNPSSKHGADAPRKRPVLPKQPANVTVNTTEPAM